jgi:hypothetical protein
VLKEFGLEGKFNPDSDSVSAFVIAKNVAEAFKH